MFKIFPQVCETLLSLGVSPNYVGFYPAAYAITLCAEQQDRLLLVTKRLYPEVAQHYKMSWTAVERNIRTVLAVIWEKNPALLVSLAHRPLQCRPRNTEFLAILSLCFRSDDATVILPQSAYNLNKNNSCY